MSRSKVAGDLVWQVTVRRSHQFYRLPHTRKTSPVYNRSVWWLWWFVGVKT